jgi:sugar phosphate isomerase/epimerase
VHERLSVHTAGFGSRPAPGLLQLLASSGVRRAGLTMGQIRLGTVRATAAAARGEGVQILDIVEPAAFDLEAPATWPARQDGLRACADAAAAVGAATLYTTTGPAPRLTWDDAASRFSGAIGPVAAYAATLGVRLAIENTISLRADLGFVHRLRDTADLARLAGTGVVADMFAAWNERDLAAALTDSLPLITHVQVADFVLGTLTTPDRAVPGDGDIPIARHLGWLRDAGYTGFVEVELLGPRVDAEGPLQASLRALAALAPLVLPPPPPPPPSPPCRPLT